MGIPEVLEAITHFLPTESSISLEYRSLDVELLRNRLDHKLGAFSALRKRFGDRRQLAAAVVLNGKRAEHACLCCHRIQAPLRVSRR